jgi:hypothetical protein
MVGDRIRVLEVGIWGIGGTDQAIEIRAAMLPPEFFEVRAVGIFGGHRLERLAARGIPSSDLRGDWTALAPLLREFRPHIVHYSRLTRRGEAPPEVQAACRDLNVPVLVETDVFGRPPGWTQARPPNRICHMSLSSMWRHARQARVSMSQLHASGHSTIYLPVPTSAGFGASPHLPRDVMRRAIGVKPDELLACRVARPDLRKWSVRLELALPKLLQAVPSLRMVFLAAPSEKVDSLRRRFGDRVICLETTADMAQVASLYTASDLMIHSSGIGESFGLSMAEAMYYGLPVIVDSTPTMDNAQVEVVEHERSGLIVGSVSGFVTAARLLAEDTARRHELGQRARERAMALFADVAVAGQWQRLYIEACRAAGVAVPTVLANRLEGVTPIPSPAEYADYPAEYDRRCDSVIGRSDTAVERAIGKVLRARDTVAYMRKLGFRAVMNVVQSRLASSGSLRRD